MVLCVFIFLVYTGGGLLGSPSVVYNDLTFAASTTRDCSVANPGQQCGPVSGNNGGSFLTMLSSGGLMFGIINIVGNFGTVFVDNVSCCSPTAQSPSVNSAAAYGATYLGVPSHAVAVPHPPQNL